MPPSSSGSHDFPADAVPKPTIFSHEFALDDRVALVTGAQRGIGLEAALALVEAGARAVYCIDLPPQPSKDWEKVRNYASRMKGKSGQGRLEYISADVTDKVRNGRKLVSRGLLAKSSVNADLGDVGSHMGPRTEHWR